MVKKPFFLGNSLCLDPVADHALDDYRRWFAQPRNREPGSVRPRTEEEIKAWLVEIGGNQKNCYFSLRVDGVNIGHLGIRGIDRQENRAELDWFIGEEEVDSGVEQKEVVSWLRYFLDVHLGLRDLVVPGGCGIAEPIFREVGFAVKGRDRRGGWVYEAAF